ARGLRQAEGELRQAPGAPAEARGPRQGKQEETPDGKPEEDSEVDHQGEAGRTQSHTQEGEVKEEGETLGAVSGIRVPRMSSAGLRPAPTARGRRNSCAGSACHSDVRGL